MAIVTGTEVGETLAGTSGDDTVTALGGNDTIMLTAGHDTADGGDGTDILFGNLDASVIAAGPRSYLLTASAFTDGSGTFDTSFASIERFSVNELSGSDVAFDASAFMGILQLALVAGGTHTITGGAGNDFLSLNRSNATIDGGAGIDAVSAVFDFGPVVLTRSGAVAQVQSEGRSIAATNVESFGISAGGSSLFVDASAFDLPVFIGGSPFVDTVSGGSANDSFFGFRNGDLIAGLGGADTFTFSNLDQFNGATILDLSGDDRISFAPQAFGPPAPPRSFIGDGSFTGIAGQYRYYTWRGETFVVADSNGDGMGDNTLTVANGAFVLGETAAGSNLLSVTATATPPDPGPNTINGTEGGDVIESGAGNDTVNGLGGNDKIDGGADNDLLNGGEGSDELFGGDGNDLLDGGAGEDFLEGEDGNDTFTGTGSVGVGAEWMAGGRGNDTFVASGGAFNIFGDVSGDGSGMPDHGNDVITVTNGSGSWLAGQGGDDVITAAGGASILADGGNGNDRITLQGVSGGIVNLGSGDDVLRISTGTFTIYLDGGRDAIRITSTGTGFFTLIGFTAGELGDQLDLSIYGADPFATGTLVMGANGPDALIDHPASGTRYVLQGVNAANLSAYNLGVSNPGYAPIGLTLDDAFSDAPEVDYAGELVGADGNDTIRGFGGDDRLFGAAGQDSLQGGLGADLLDGGTGADTMAGGPGDDGYTVDDAGDAVAEGAAEGTFDRIFTSGSYALGAGVHVEALTTTDAAGTAAISLTGNEFANFIGGNAGANVIDGGGGADIMVGLGGDDWYTVDNAGDTVIEGVAEGTFDRIFARASYTQGAGVHVEALTIADAASTAAINLTGNEFANFIGGNAGANVLDGGGGADTLVGLGGDDWYYVDHAGDVVVEGAGQGSFDRIFARASYTQGTGVFVEALTIADAAGTAAIDLDGNELANFIGGNAGANTLSGGAGDDTLIGLGGDDRLVGGIGADTMIGGTGDDWYYVDHAGDAVTEGAAEGSFDRIFASASFALGAGVHIEALTIADAAGTTAINLGGNELANFIGGNAGTNVIDGGANADTMIGLGGDDWYYVDNAGDVVIEGAADGAFDRIFARASYTQGAGVHVEALTIADAEGTAAIDLTGNERDNFIGGNAGANVLDGRGGADTMVGLGGQDTFAFTTTLGGGNVDAVIGFVAADDTIQLDDAVFTGLATGALAAGAFVTGSAAADADDRIVYDSATGALWFDADGNGAGAAMQFATLGTGLALTSADFLVI